jgi:peptidoglycan/xylan/chitin deacetylase (PgdA/CDA1 family)
MFTRLAASALFVASMATAQPSMRSVALTFDDLPFADAGDAHTARDKALTANKQIQDALERYSAPAIGCVNEARVRRLGPAGLAILKSWNRGPFELGNHGFAHLDSNGLTLPLGASKKNRLRGCQPMRGAIQLRAGRGIDEFKDEATKSE